MTRPRLAHYDILEQVGRGGMGVVLKAHDTRLERIVALKILPALASTDAERRQRFLREARAEARLNHPAIATVYEVGEAEFDDPELAPPSAADGRPGRLPYIAMEYVEGRDLQELVAERRPSPKEILSIAIQIADGLDAAHSRGVIHRDLKPHNIRITPEGRVKLLDFGLAKLLTRGGPEAARRSGETFLTEEGMIAGTIPYIAPEQVEGLDPDPRSDLFAFGVVLYQLITGKLPFSSSSLVSFVRSVTDDKPPRVSASNPGAHPDLDPVVERLLEVEPEDRFQSAREVADRLKEMARGGPPSGQTPVTRPLPDARPRPRRRPIWIAGLGALAALAVALAWLWRGAPVAGVATVAMMPFENLTGRQEMDATVRSLQSAVGDRVARLAGLVDARRTAAMVDNGLPDAEVAGALGADYLLRGELQHQDHRPSLQLRLSDAVSGLQLWRLTFDRPDLRSELLWITEDYLRVLLSPHQTRRRASEPAEAAQSLNLYFSARERLERGGEREELLTTTESFRRVTRTDPRSPAAWTGLAEAAWALYWRTRSESALLESERAARQANLLDPDDPRARIAAAKVARARDSVDRSITELRAILEDPGLPEIDRADVYYQLSLGHDQLGDADEAIRTLELAIAKRPEFWRWWNQLGIYRSDKADYEGAEAAMRRAIELAPPGVGRPRETLIALAGKRGDHAEAARECTQLEASFPITNAFTLSNCGTAFFFVGDCAKAESFYLKTVAQLPGQATGWANLGDARVCRGQEARAQEAYGRAVGVLEEKRAEGELSANERAVLPLYLAKSGSCEGEGGAVRQAEALLVDDSASPDSARLAAKTHALCGRRELALAAVARARALGVPTAVLRSAPELARLAEDPEFKRLLAAPAGSPP